MTSDGISEEEWDIVKEIAASIANAAINEDRSFYKRAVSEMQDCLGKLKCKYGELPSILATEADYMEDPHRGSCALQQALKIARSMGDQKNVILILQSLVELYFEDIRDNKQANLWLDMLSREPMGKVQESEIDDLKLRLKKKGNK